MKHIWQGSLIDDEELLTRLHKLPEEINETLQETLKTEDVLEACDNLAQVLLEYKNEEMIAALVEDGCENPQEFAAGLADNINRKSLTIKLQAELGTTRPFEVRRINYTEQKFEAWSPMGVLVHITAGNSPVVAPMAAVEGLLTGNINIIKVASNIGSFAAWFFSELSKYANLAKFLYMLRVSSKRKEIISEIIANADCVSVWGGEDAVAAIREMTPKGIPIVTWGHRISFAYLTPKAMESAVDGLVYSVCRNEQQSCSSPQCVLIDTDDPEDVNRFAALFDKALKACNIPQKTPDLAQSAEITTVTELHKADLYFNDGDFIEAEDHTYRLLICYTPKFMPSPLFRTVWISPMPHGEIIKRLRGMRQYLQTAGLACTLEELGTLTDLLYRAGVTRITPVGSMSASYTGEPHDGVFALPRFLKRVSLRTELSLPGILNFSELKEPVARQFSGPIQGKKDYPPVPENGTRVLMKSGGTTGEPVYCSYTQNDYERYILEPSIESLLSCGFDPEHDVMVDLLKCGNLYGGMNCFISVFDKMNAPHLNVSGLDDFGLVADFMIKGKATAILGAPSYILRLFKENAEKFKEYGRLKKVFFAGEHMSDGQQAYLKSLGIELIAPILYGANETGTMGIACGCCPTGVYHLCSDIQHLEILKMDEDKPVDKGETGRLVFTGYLRENGHTERYEIGDLGRWVEGECACGRKQPRFELLGRYGDIIRMGGTFFNYQRIAKILSEKLNYNGRLQLILERKDLNEKMIFCLENIDITSEKLKEVLLASGYDSFKKTVPTNLVEIEARILQPEEFIINEVSIKLRSIIDRR
ncbi:aldehyde dehydrogenase family protein [Candidatus Methanomassiliicoccus intestinalis]|uniref:aldehyde dehydrogenase family protein n=1 Tax=Candidatus Methanomassiliicoccus intestinalis TaxID=1406512 RepID=UPI0037DC5AAD